MVLRLIYLLPTSQAPLPFRVHLTHLVLLVTMTSWDLEHSERHPPLHLSHLRRHSSFNWHKTSLPLVASSSSLPAAAHPSPFFSNQQRDSGISVGSVLSSNTDSDPGKTQLRKRKHTDNGRSAPPSTKRSTTSRSKSKTDDLNPVIITNALNSTLNRLADVMQKTLDASQATATKSTIASAAAPSMTNAIPPIVTPPIESQPTQPSSDPSSVSPQGILNQAIEVATSDDTLSEDELFAASLFFTSATEEAVPAASTFIALGNNQVVQRHFLRRQLDVAALLPGKGKGKAVNSEDGDDPMVY